jgi:uncharacterized protein
MVAGTHDGVIKIKVCAPPVEGAANRELQRFLSRQLNISESRVKLVRGAKSRMKQFEIDRMSQADILTLLDVALPAASTP